MSNNHQDLDALPLPAPTHFRNGVLYAFSADQIRADRIKVWELAMRKAQEGREPVARVELMQTGGNVGLATRIVEIDDPLRERLRPGTKLYTSPPPTAEGREPVAWRVRRSDGEHELFFHEPTAKQRAECFVPHSSAEPLFTSPPPKSDEERDAERLLIAAQAVVDWHGELGHDSLAMAELRAALAAQQKGGA